MILNSRKRNILTSTAKLNFREKYILTPIAKLNYRENKKFRDKALTAKFSPRENFSQF